MLVNDVKHGDIVLLAGQPCEVDDLEVLWDGKPGSSAGTMKVTGFSLTQDYEVEETFKLWTNISIFAGEPRKCDYVVVRTTPGFVLRVFFIDMVPRLASKAILYNSANSIMRVCPSRWTSVKKRAEQAFANFSGRENGLVRLSLYTHRRSQRLINKQLCVSRAFWKFGGSSNIMMSQSVQTGFDSQNLTLSETAILGAQTER